MPEQIPTDIALLLGELKALIRGLDDKLTLHVDASTQRLDKLEDQVFTMQMRINQLEGGRKTLLWLAGGIPLAMTVILWIAPFLATYGAK